MNDLTRQILPCAPSYLLAGDLITAGDVEVSQLLQVACSANQPLVSQSATVAERQSLQATAVRRNRDEALIRYLTYHAQ